MYNLFWKNLIKFDKIVFTQQRVYWFGSVTQILPTQHLPYIPNPNKKYFEN